jgi:hypothetical protein
MLEYQGSGIQGLLRIQFKETSIMGHYFSKSGLGLGLAMVFSFSGCNTESTDKADPNGVQPKTEATVIGVWHSNVKIVTPPIDLNIDLTINADHKQTAKILTATGQPAPADYMEISTENATWSVAGGKLISVKTTCTYVTPDPATGAMTPVGDCRAPLKDSVDINVKGKAWTIIKDGQPAVFLKD